jgi:hypothetical protein
MTNLPQAAWSDFTVIASGSVSLGMTLSTGRANGSTLRCGFLFSNSRVTSGRE